MRPTATIVSTGIANVASVGAALRRCGVEVVVSDDPATIESATLLVLPGVGAFGAGMARLASTGAAQVIIDRIDAGWPTLGVCLGMQLLCAASDESPGVRGLGVVQQRVCGFNAGVRTPQFGWNRIEPGDGCQLLEPGMAYFANSFRVTEPPAGWRVALSTHDGPFVAAMERDGVLACQFHPELSGTYGQRLLSRWVARAMEVSPC